jgi:hypothetical protein
MRNNSRVRCGTHFDIVRKECFKFLRQIIGDVHKHTRHKRCGPEYRPFLTRHYFKGQDLANHACFRKRGGRQTSQPDVYAVIHIQNVVMMRIPPYRLDLLDDGFKRLRHVKQWHAIHTVNGKSSTSHAITLRMFNASSHASLRRRSSSESYFPRDRTSSAVKIT